MIALIDGQGDIIAFRCAASAEDDEDWVATSRIEKLLEDIFKATAAESHKIFLTGKNNFRYQIDPEYKANRKDKPKPKWLSLCRDFLASEYNAQVTDGYEADDALAMEQTTDTVVVSTDKDLLQIPGMHYRFVKGEWIDIDQIDGLQHFYRNLLIGDTSDNIRGVDGIGKVRAGKLIDPLYTEGDMFEVVRHYYNDDERLLRNGKLMHLWRFQNDVWSKSETLFGASESTTEPEPEVEPEF